MRKWSGVVFAVVTAILIVEYFVLTAIGAKTMVVIYESLEPKKYNLPPGVYAFWNSAYQWSVVVCLWCGSVVNLMAIGFMLASIQLIRHKVA